MFDSTAPVAVTHAPPVKYSTASPLAHVGHTWEEWHAYLSDHVPPRVPMSASGIYCHDCRAVCY